MWEKYLDIFHIWQLLNFPSKGEIRIGDSHPPDHHNLTFSGFKTKSSGGNNLQSSWKFVIMNIAAPFSVYSNCDDLPFALMIPEGPSERSDITLACIPPNWVISPSSWWRNPQITCQSLRKLIFIGPESDHCLPLSVTDSLTDWLLFSRLYCCDPGVWRCQLKTCWCCNYCWWWLCWQQFVTDLDAEVWSKS